MHSFHQSRGRILFEVLCALGVVASCVGAWKQTGASALLVAASVAGLYGFVHLFDLARHDPADAEEPQRIEFEPEPDEPQRINFAAKSEDDLADYRTPVVPIVTDEPTGDGKIEEAEVVEPAATRAKAPRKGSRRAKTPKEAKVVGLAPFEAVEVLKPLPVEEVAPLPLASSEKMEVFEPTSADEVAHPHIAPLFEPEPFARMPRRAFGRRGRI
jgi:hypothetical protein